MSENIHLAPEKPNTISLVVGSA